jgi:hypothetical protein
LNPSSCDRNIGAPITGESSHGHRRRNDDLQAAMARTQRDSEARADALATIELFNARLAGGKTAWFWPTIEAALATEHHWLVIACNSCGTVIDLDLRVKRRNDALSGARRCHGNTGFRLSLCACYYYIRRRRRDDRVLR